MLRRGFFVVLVLTASLILADNMTRLILKDGSYQVITKYEKVGDRVRYYSAERNEWEEVPAELVDWNATNTYQKNQQAQASSEAADDKRKQAQEDNETVSKKDAITPEVAPNLRLPESGGVFAVDSFHSTPQLIELVQTGSQTNDHTGTYLLLKTIDPIASRRQTIEIPGPHAKVQLHTGHPYIYLNLDTDPDTDTSEKRNVYEPRPSSDAYIFQILKLGTSKNHRTLATTYINAADQSTDSAKSIQTIGQLTPGNIWVKIQPKDDLPPGEYAVVLSLNGKINSYVWDFGVNPSAPQNPSFQPGQQKAANPDDSGKRMKE